MEEYKQVRVLVVMEVDVRTLNQPGSEEELLDRVLEATVPHPDSRIATSLAGEFVTCIVLNTEVSSR